MVYTSIVLPRKKLLLVVDFANLAHAENRWELDLIKFLKYCRSRVPSVVAYLVNSLDTEDLCIQRVYSTLTRHGWRVILRNLVPKDEAVHSSNMDDDICEIIESELLKNGFEAAMIITGDGDFVEIGRKIREAGKDFLVSYFGTSQSLSKDLLALAGDHFLDLNAIRSLVELRR